MTTSTPEAQIINQLAPWRAKHRRTAWKPVTAASTTSDQTGSKFGGTPSISAGQTWPTCGTCDEPMTFFMQLDLDSLPAELNQQFGQGLLQLFYCTNDDDDCTEGWQPFSEEHHVRIIPSPTASAANTNPQTQPAVPEDIEVFPEHFIASWTPEDDFPSDMEHDELGLHFDWDFVASPQTCSITCDEVGLARTVLDGEPSVPAIAGDCSDQDKFGGWPRWVQGPEYPSCPQCDSRMHVVFQLASMKHVPFHFGDAGVGHITQCPTHRDVVTFGWACS